MTDETTWVWRCLLWKVLNYKYKLFKVAGLLRFSISSWVSFSSTWFWEIDSFNLNCFLWAGLLLLFLYYLFNTCHAYLLTPPLPFLVLIIGVRSLSLVSQAEVYPFY